MRAEIDAALSNVFSHWSVNKLQDLDMFGDEFRLLHFKLCTIARSNSLHRFFFSQVERELNEEQILGKLKNISADV